jgi:hypothetical protein
MFFSEWLLIKENIQRAQAQKFTLNDIDPRLVYDVFYDTYKKSTGQAWDYDTFVSRAYNWTFYGIPPQVQNDAVAGFVAVRFQRSGLIKLTGMAGNGRSILAGLTMLNATGKPIWGAVSDEIARLAEKRGFMVAPPEVMKQVAPFIPDLKVDDSGNVVANVRGIGDVSKKVIINSQYKDWLMSQNQYAGMLKGMNF